MTLQNVRINRDGMVAELSSEKFQSYLYRSIESADSIDQMIAEVIRAIANTRPIIDMVPETPISAAHVGYLFLVSEWLGKPAYVEKLCLLVNKDVALLPLSPTGSFIISDLESQASLQFYPKTYLTNKVLTNQVAIGKLMSKVPAFLDLNVRNNFGLYADKVISTSKKIILDKANAIVLRNQLPNNYSS